MITEKVEISDDVIFTKFQNGMIASNIRVRKHIWIDFNFINFILTGNFTNPVLAKDMTCFSNIDGLLADPTNLIRNENSIEIKFTSKDDAVSFLKKSFLIIEENEYKNFLNKKKSILDKSHYGTFHQQLGVELRLNKRIDPDEWWYNQKFEKSSGLLKDNLYKFIQEEFLTHYFSGMELKNKIVIDFGCGSGMASKRFIERGARVIGVDPNKNLLKIAEENCEKGKFEPFHLDLTLSDPYSSLKNLKSDLVWMADVFLFYFYSPNGKEPVYKPEKLLSDLTHGLSNAGKCIIMQPHGYFWLMPWMGSPDRPYTILSEYAERLYSVVPSLTELTKAIFSANLTIVKLEEPTPINGENIDKRAYNFSKNFPLWWVFETMKVNLNNESKN